MDVVGMIGGRASGIVLPRLIDIRHRSPFWSSADEQRISWCGMVPLSSRRQFLRYVKDSEGAFRKVGYIIRVRRSSTRVISRTFRLAGAPQRAAF